MMKHKYFIHVLVTLVLVASMLVSLTSGAMGKYTNAGLGVFSTLASVYFSDYKVVGSIIVDDGSGGSIEPGIPSDSVWGAGEDIVNEDERPNYGWEDAEDISYVIKNDTDEDLYLYLDVQIALPHYRIGGGVVLFYPDYTVSATCTATDNPNEEVGSSQEHEGHFNTWYSPEDKFQITNNDEIFHTGSGLSTRRFYLYILHIKTNIVIRRNSTYECHFNVTVPDDILDQWSEAIATGSTYHSIKIIASREGMPSGWED